MADTTPVTYTLPAGTYVITARYREFSESKTVTLKAGETSTVEFRWHTKAKVEPWPVIILGGVIAAAALAEKRR